jgi:Putative ATPase subunit of terminase (gpP-like)
MIEYTLDDGAKRDAAINLLATGYSPEEVTEMLGLKKSTLHHWRYTDPEFGAIVRNLKQQVGAKAYES